MDFSYNGWPVWEGDFQLKNMGSINNKKNGRIIYGKVSVLFPSTLNRIKEFSTSTKAIITTDKKRRFVVRVEPKTLQNLPEAVRNEASNSNILGFVSMESYGLDNIYIIGGFNGENEIQIKLIKYFEKNQIIDSMGYIPLKKTNDYSLSFRFTGILCSVQ